MAEQRRVAWIGGKKEESAGESLGRGIGQQTGGGAAMDAAEAGKLLGMITRACPSRDELEAATDIRTGHFVASLLYGNTPKDSDPWRNWEDGWAAQVTGKQLFWLRDIKDRLIEAGKL